VSVRLPGGISGMLPRKSLIRQSGRVGAIPREAMGRDTTGCLPEVIRQKRLWRRSATTSDPDLRQRRATFNGGSPPSLLLYHNEWLFLRSGGIGQMVDVLLRKRRRRRCYFCQQVRPEEAFYTDICWWHQVRISLRLLVLLVRSGRFHVGKLWRMVRWWKL
jgi:hypothetical protein